jgi:enterochelin esterase-like enzyme
MRTGRLIPLLAALAAAVVLPAPAGAEARTLDTAFSSRALGGTLRFEVYLPTGYATGGLRYPVVYFLHGLPSQPTAYRNVRFVERALDAVGSPAILVVPQAARAGEPDPEYVDRGPGDRWATAVADELPRVVDARFRTIADRRGRALVGYSAGGYGAMHLALRHLDAFSVVESWSGYFHPTDPTGTKPLELGSADRDARADVHRQLGAVRGRLRSLPTYIAFYVGRADRRFAAENRQLDRELSAAGVPHVFRLYPGGHGWSLWRRHAPAWLALALAHLAPAR